MLSLRKVGIAVGVAVAVFVFGFVVGRANRPIAYQVREVETLKIDERIVTVTSVRQFYFFASEEHSESKTSTLWKTLPDGTRLVLELRHDVRDLKTIMGGESSAESSSTADRKEEKRTEKETKPIVKDWAISFYAVKPLDLEIGNVRPVVQIERRILGPFSVGVLVGTKDLGAGIKGEF